MQNEQRLKDYTASLEKRFHIKTAILRGHDVPFDPTFRKFCEENLCGQYGQNHGCPPGAGDIHHLIDNAKSYKHAIVVQKAYAKEGLEDWDSINHGVKDFKKTLRQVTDDVEQYDAPVLTLATGDCEYCTPCKAVTHEPCPYPTKKRSSVSAYGVDITKLAALTGLESLNSEDRITYFGIIFVG